MQSVISNIIYLKFEEAWIFVLKYWASQYSIEYIYYKLFYILRNWGNDKFLIIAVKEIIFCFIFCFLIVIIDFSIILFQFL